MGLNSIRHQTVLYFRLVLVQLQSQLQYRAAFMFDIVGTGFLVFIEFAAVAVVFERFEHIKGWTLGEVALLWAIVEISFGLMDMLFQGFDPPRFAEKIRLGTFDQLLLRPVNITLQVLASELELRRIGKIVLGIGIFFLALRLTNIEWTSIKLLLVPCMIISMTMFFAALFMFGSTITFWTVQSIDLLKILTYGGSYLMTYPMHIYQTWMRRVFTFIIPAIFLNYYPALYILDKPDPFNLPSFAPFIGIVLAALMLLLAYRFWIFGIRHYQSTGS